MIIVGFLGLIVLLFVIYLDSEGWGRKKSVLAFLITVTVVLSADAVSKIPPEGYTKVETYSYVTEDGTVETLEGPYYKKDGTYYRQEIGATACWIPFGKREYVEIDLPESQIQK